MTTDDEMIDLELSIELHRYPVTLIWLTTVLLALTFLGGWPL